MSNRKDAFYFPHDSNAHNDERIIELRAEFGWEGYGIYWALIERMRDASDYRIRMRSRNALAFALGIDRELFIRLTDFCIECGLFAADEDQMRSPALDRRMAEVEQLREKRRAAGAKGGKAKAEQGNGAVIDDEEQSSSNATANDEQSSSLAKHERKGKEKKEDSIGHSHGHEMAESIYAEYPRKVKRIPALKAIRSAIDRGEDPEALLTAVRDFAAYWTERLKIDPGDRRYIPHPASWFNAEGYNDRDEWTDAVADTEMLTNAEVTLLLKTDPDAFRKRRLVFSLEGQGRFIPQARPLPDGWIEEVDHYATTNGHAR